MLPRDPRSVRRRAGRLLIVVVALVATCGGCRVMGPPALPSPPGPSSIPPGSRQDQVKDEKDGRDDVKPARYEPIAEATSSPECDPEGPPPPLTLPEAITFGLQNNPRLQQAAARAAAAREGADIAFAPFLPELNYQYVFDAFNKPVIPGGAFVPASLQRGVFNFSLNEFGIQWTIYDFGRRAGRYGQAINRARAEALAMERARQTVAFDVRWASR